MRARTEPAIGAIAAYLPGVEPLSINDYVQAVLLWGFAPLEPEE